MKWFFALVASIGLFAFTLYAWSGVRSNEAYEYDELTQEYVNVNDTGSTRLWDKFIKVAQYMVVCADDSFSSVKTFNVQDDSLAARFFSNPVINILFLPINYVVNLYRFFVKTINLFVSDPWVDSSFGGGGGGFHGGR